MIYCDVYPSQHIKSDRAGAALGYHVVSMSEDAVREQNFNEPIGWYKHFDKWIFTHTGYEIARPCMFQGEPYWRGGLGIKIGDFHGQDEERIYDMKENDLVVYSSRLYEPTTKEYIKYFMKHIELGTYRIFPQDKSIKRYHEKASRKKKSKYRKSKQPV